MSHSGLCLQTRLVQAHITFLQSLISETQREHPSDRLGPTLQRIPVVAPVEMLATATLPSATAQPIYSTSAASPLSLAHYSLQGPSLCLVTLMVGNT